MPYIKQDEREEVFLHGAISSGQLNYVLSRTINKYMQMGQGLSYQRINDVLGALEGAKLEFYRRVAVPYENGKLSKNGDVYSAGLGAGTSSVD